MKKYILLVITCLLVLFPTIVKAEDTFETKIGKMSKKDAIKACETGNSDTYACYRYTFIPLTRPMYNTTVWTNKSLGCGFEKTDWDYSTCKSAALDATYEQCKKIENVDKEGNKKEYKYCKTIAHSGYNGTPDFYYFGDDKDSSITCDNVKPFHIIYRTITVMAPILTILFATFDLIASVMSGDPKKISKFRSKIFRRVIALLILMVLPVLISILVDSLSKNNAIRDTSLLRCVIIGND